VPDQSTRIFRHPAVLSFPAVVAAIELVRMSLIIIFLPSFLTALNRINPAFKYNTDAIGLILSANLIADNLCKGAAGWLVDRKGPWPVLFGGILIALAGLLMILGNYDNYLLMVVGSVLVGIGVAPTWPASVSGALQITGEEKRATMISLISVVWLLGAGSGTIINGFLIDSDAAKLVLNGDSIPQLVHAYANVFIVMILAGLAALVIGIFGWISWRRVPHIKTKLARETGKKPGLVTALKRLWTIKALVPGMLVQTLALGMLLPNLLPYATIKLGLNEAQYTTLLLIGGIVVVLFMIPVGRMADRWGSKLFLVSGFALAALSMFIMITYGDRYNIWWVVGFFGLSYALIQPAWNALMASSIPPEQRGILMGLFMAVEGIGFGLGPLVGGKLGEIKLQAMIGVDFGMSLPFYVSAFILGIMAVVYFIYPFHHYHFEEN
jgi:DHA1 family multidrug resistance protein-like MFS transporter